MKYSRTLRELHQNQNRRFHECLAKVLHTQYSHLTPGRYKAHGRGVVRILVTCSSCMWTGHSSTTLHMTFAHIRCENYVQTAQEWFTAPLSQYILGKTSPIVGIFNFFDIRILHKSFVCPVKTYTFNKRSLNKKKVLTKFLFELENSVFSHAKLRYMYGKIELN